MPGIVRWTGVEALKKQKRARVVARWAKYRPLQRFLQDHFPGPWENIRRCRMAYKPMHSVERPGHYKVIPIYRCHEYPFCIECVRERTGIRVRETLDQFHRCTPRGEKPRFIHIVQTAPIYDDGTGWGVEASRNVKAFGGIVWDTLQESYGKGIGAKMSYQDFGERAFNKRHPHMDLTLNGWMLQDGAPIKTPYYELKGNGRTRWDNSIAHAATRLRLDAKPGNVKIEAVRLTVAEYYGVLSYQMRELVDLTKLDYSRDQRMVWWLDYGTNRRERFMVHEFKAGLAEYQWRLKQWPQGEDKEMKLHRGYGHLSNRMVPKTQAAMGGLPMKHGGGCPCSECGDWEPVLRDPTESQPRDGQPGPATPLP